MGFKFYNPGPESGQNLYLTHAQAPDYGRQVRGLRYGGVLFLVPLLNQKKSFFFVSGSKFPTTLVLGLESRSHKFWRGHF